MNDFDLKMQHVSASQRVVEAMRDLKPYWERITSDPTKLYEMRKNLKSIMSTVTTTGKQVYIAAALTLLNLHIKETQGLENKCKVARMKNNIPFMTDHAFVQGLRRYQGIDIDAQKKRMWERALRNDWNMVINNNAVITILPKWGKQR